MKIVKVKYTLLNTNSSNKIYYFKTDIEDLKIGDVLLVDSQGREVFGHFYGYSNANKKPTRSVIRKVEGLEMKKFWSAIERRLIKKPLKLSKIAYERYCKNVKGNSETTYQQANKKLTRNVIMASKFKWKNAMSSKNRFIFNYGFLQIDVSGNTIVTVKNMQPFKKFVKSEFLYNKLNKKLGIKSDIK